MGQPNGFFGVFLHQKTIPDLRPGHYVLGTGRAPGDKVDMVIMTRFDGMQEALKDGGAGIVSGKTAKEVQDQAYKILREYDGLLAQGISPRDALLQIAKALPAPIPPSSHPV